MRRLVPALVLTLSLLVAGSASATTLASRFPALDAELQARLALIPATHLTKLQKRQKPALNRARAALAVDVDDLGRTVADAKKAIGATDGTFPADATLDPLETAVVEALEGDATLRNGSLVRGIQTLAPGKAQIRAQAKSDFAAAKLAASQTATTHVARLKLVAAAVVAMTDGEKIVKKAGGSIGAGVTSTALDVDINTPATHLHLPAAMPPFGLYQVVYDTASDKFTLTAQGTLNAVPNSFVIVVPGHGTGTRSVPAGAPSTFSAPGVTPPAAFATGGTINFTTWDTVNLQVGGTFDVTYSNGTNTVHLATGTFSSLQFVVQ